MGSGYRLAAVAGAILGLAALLVATAALAGGAGGGSATRASAQVVEVDLGDLFIKPGQITVATGADVTFKVKNIGGVEHNLAIEGGPTTRNLKAGEAAELTFKAEKASYNLLCTMSRT